MKGDGLSQSNRIQRLNALDVFEPLHSCMQTLLRQAKDIASFIRYYDLYSQSDGYFDAFLEDIKTFQTENSDFVFDGNMEPSQATLYAFLHNLNGIIQDFNQRWKNEYISWYINQILRIRSEIPPPDFTWICFKSNLDENILVEKDTRFTYSGSTLDNKIYYNLTENIEVSAINIAKSYAIYLEKNEDVFPANFFNIPIALHKKDFKSVIDSHLFEKKQKKTTIHPIGLFITSPSLLLSEGKRKVTLYIYPEAHEKLSLSQKRQIVRLFQQKNRQQPYLSKKDIKEEALIKSLNTIFYLELSSSDGWETINNYNIKYEGEYLKIQFCLGENFPAIIACSEEIHETVTNYPGLRILLNHDAWLYPYAWLKDFMIQKIIIDTHVENVSNILYYNDLGLVDISAPFSPFGINKEKGAWFVIGNYEMAKKNLKSLDLNIEWGQLPENKNGLHDYYRDYKKGINSLSFKIRPQYLSDYRWSNTDNAEPFYLFSTQNKDLDGNPEAAGKLATISSWQNIHIKDLHPIQCTEDNYEYNIQSKTGFFKFVLDAPEIGLGEKYYRQLYTQLMMGKRFRKNKIITLNEPINPQISRITLSYKASDETDLRICSETQDTSLFHIYPLGEQQVYPQKNNKPIPFVYNLETDACIVFGLENVKGDEMLHLYFEFSPLKDEVSLTDLPIITWSWGDGYHWERLPDDTILSNTTMNFLMNGSLKIYIPPVPEKGFRDKNGSVWISANIVKNERRIAPLLRIYNNAAKVVKDFSYQSEIRTDNFIIDESEKDIPGITEIVQIGAFSEKQEPETEKQKVLQISEYITHRQRAITARDYERIALQAFPEIEKVKCIYNASEKKVCIVIIPGYWKNQPNEYPYPSPGLLLEVEEYFSHNISSAVKVVDAIPPVYEDIMVRCEVTLNWTNYSKASSRAILSKAINRIIAPWQKKREPPILGYSFTLQELYDKIDRLNQIEKIIQLSVIHLYQNYDNKHIYKEYANLEDIIYPSTPYSILVPHKDHLFISEQDSYGINEMKIAETYTIWHDETGKH